VKRRPDPVAWVSLIIAAVLMVQLAIIQAFDLSGDQAGWFGVASRVAIGCTAILGIALWRRWM
jgi:hypothetical protein